MNDWIEQERMWEQSVRRQNRENLIKWVWLVMGILCLIALLLVASTPSQGQELPDKPQRIMDWSFVAIHGAAGALQARDLYLTSVGVSHGCQEASSNLGPHPTNQHLVVVGLSEFTGVVALDAGMKALARHNKLPRWFGIVGGSLAADVSMFKHGRGSLAWQNTNCL